jgi:hypothetical protein
MAGFRNQRHCLSRDGIASGAVCFGLVILANALAAFAAPPLDSTSASPPAVASACVLTSDAVADAASHSFPVADESGSALAFGFVTFDWDPAAGIPGFGPLTTPPRSFASRME